MAITVQVIRYSQGDRRIDGRGSGPLKSFLALWARFSLGYGTLKSGEIGIITKNSQTAVGNYT